MEQILFLTYNTDLLGLTALFVFNDNNEENHPVNHPRRHSHDCRRAVSLFLNRYTTT